MNTKNKTIGLGILTNYLQYILSILLGLILSPLVLKYAGQETMGGYTILLQAISYVALIDLGVGYSSSRFVSQSYALGQDEFVKTCNMYRSIAILQNSAMAILFILLSFFIQNIFDFSIKLAYEMQISLWLLAIWTFISSPWSFYSGILYSTNYLSTQNIIEGIVNLIKLLLAILFVILGWSIIGLIAAQIISQFLGLFVKWYYTTKRVGKIKFGFSLKLHDKFKEILAFSFNSFFITIAIKLVFSTDSLLIGYLYGPIAVSIYYLTFQPGSMLNQFVLKITDNLTPSVNMWYVNGEMDKLKSSFFILFRVSFFFIVLMLWGIVFCTETIINLWVGSANYLAQPMPLWCGLFLSFVALAHIPNHYVMAAGRIKTLSYFALFEGVLNLTLSLILGKALGSHAVMLSSLIANIPTTIYLFYEGIRILNCKKEFLSEIFRVNYFLAILLIPAIWLNLDKLFEHYYIFDNLPKVLISIAISYPIAIIYMYYSILTRLERNQIKKLFKVKK